MGLLRGGAVFSPSATKAPLLTIPIADVKQKVLEVKL